ncbi:MAG: hypothetical protein LBM98_11240, partial [Oscillospiraceae bacterium]|jgi:hypothetical protein|nr:hypothetical protein [Oscillospiraceae bacterium]
VAYGGIRWHSVAYGGIRWHTVAYGGIRWHTVAYGGIRWHTVAYGGIRWHTAACTVTGQEFVIASRGTLKIRRNETGAAIQCRERNIRICGLYYWIASHL